MFEKEIKSGSNILIPEGIHYVTEPILLRGRDIRITGRDGAVLRGTARLKKADFTETQPGVWCASVSQKADAFYVGERKYSMARYPKADRPGDVFDGYAADCILPEKTKFWADPTGGYIHAMHAHLWGGYIYRIDGKNEDGTLALSGGWQNNRQMGMHKVYRYAENIFEEMTQPGEWYFDEKNMRVFVRPFPGDDLDNAEIAVSSCFFILEDCENVTVENLTLERSARTFMDTKEPVLRSDWTIYRGGAVLVKNSANCLFDRCAFMDVGSNGVFVDGRNENIRVTRTHFNNIGASGLCFMGYPDAVKAPLFEYSQTQHIDDTDLTPGPASDNYPRNCAVEDCLIEYVGTVEKQATGVEISMAYGITVKDCTVCHTSRSGINISEGAFGGHRIEGCDVFDTVRETGDHGCFNSWGRDRYWNLQGLDPADAGKYASIDMVDGNVITRSRFRCDRGWDIDLDDGSSNYLITENLCLNGGIKLREGFFRTVHHNICVNNTMHYHAWYPQSGDVVENNILFEEYSIYAMPENWGKKLDNNILFAAGQDSPAPTDVFAALSKQDSASYSIDPMFADPAASDYRPTNPRLSGFENFPKEFGVRYSPLRAKAESPVLPTIREKQEAEESRIISVCNMKVKNIETDGEMSVYGTAEHNGALIMAIGAASEAEKRGLAVSDVIVLWGDKAINNIDDLADCTFDADVPVTVLRKQHRTVL
ncbi:MAG: peptide-binding protein [Ruminococcaceae bacterium]|nr:peptide-binding protein [Oscillospiraceae bacterium]